MMNFFNITFLVNSIVILLLIYIFVKITFEGRTGLLFLNKKIYFPIVLLITDLILSFINNKISFALIIAIIFALISLHNFYFMSFKETKFKTLFFSYSYRDIDDIIIQNYTDYSNTIVLTINFKMSKPKKFICPYNTSIFTTLNTLNIPIQDNFKKMDLL